MRVRPGGTDHHRWRGQQRDRRTDGARSPDTAKVSSVGTKAGRSLACCIHRHRIPLVGTFDTTDDGRANRACPGAKGVYAAYGYGGNEITFSFLAAQSIGDLIAVRRRHCCTILRWTGQRFFAIDRAVIGTLALRYFFMRYKRMQLQSMQ